MAVIVDNNPRRIERIHVKVTGMAQANWSVRQQDYNANNTTTVTTTLYGSWDTYINYQKVLWSRDSYPPTSDLPVGKTDFDFDFMLPRSCPPSFEGSFGYIRYEVEARVFRSGLREVFLKSAVKAPISVRRKRSDLLYRVPQTGEIIKRVGFDCCSFGSVTAMVTVPYTGFTPGDPIPLTVNVHNQSTRNIRVVGLLKRVDTFHAAGYKKQKSKNVAKLVGPQIPAGETTSFETRGLIIGADFPTTIRSCRCIDVEYYLVVKVAVPWSFSKQWKIPVTIAYPGT